jgi:hypothetical protein
MRLITLPSNALSQTHGPRTVCCQPEVFIRPGQCYSMISLLDLKSYAIFLINDMFEEFRFKKLI